MLQEKINSVNEKKRAKTQIRGKRNSDEKTRVRTKISNSEMWKSQRLSRRRVPDGGSTKIRSNWNKTFLLNRG